MKAHTKVMVVWEYIFNHTRIGSRIDSTGLAPIFGYTVSQASACLSALETRYGRIKAVDKHPRPPRQGGNSSIIFEVISLEPIPFRIRKAKGGYTLDRKPGQAHPQRKYEDLGVARPAKRKYLERDAERHRATYVPKPQPAPFPPPAPERPPLTTAGGTLPLSERLLELAAEVAQLEKLVANQST